MKPGLKRFIQSWMINTLAVLIAVLLLPGLRFQDQSPWMHLLTALVLAVLNASLRPLMMMVALPLLVFTLGLFSIVINACLLYVAKGIVSLVDVHFEIDSFWWAMLGALVIGVISLPLHILTGTSQTRVMVQRGQRPRDAKSGRGDRSVIDV